MTISEACYATREQVKSALDAKQTAYNDEQVDRAIQSASRSVDGFLHRVFFTTFTTNYFDWPNFQSAYPWRIWFDEAELADVTVTVPVVTSGGNVIPNENIFWGHPRYAPPYTYMELDRSTSSSFGQGDTPQRDVAILGQYGHGIGTAPAGALGGALADTTGTAVTGTNGALVGVGDTIIVGTEKMLVTDKSMVTSSQTQQGSGVSTDSQSDNLLAVTDGTKYAAGEILLLDSERMIVRSVAGNNLTVERAWDGSVLAAHSGSSVYVLRLFTVTRGAFGSTAATHLISAPVTRHLVPSLVVDLAVAEAVVQVAQETGAYSRSQGTGDNTQTGIGSGIGDIRKRCFAKYGRKARSRAV